LVVISSQKTTLFNKRTGKGIWKNLYQFPLVETEAPLSSKQFKKHPKVKTILNDINFEYSLYNNTDIIHKLSHQHLYTRFWIVEVDLLPKKSVLLTELKTYPVPVLISNFINEFDLAL
jgi:A/G-specific adenine glycosylase